MRSVQDPFRVRHPYDSFDKQKTARYHLPGTNVEEFLISLIEKLARCKLPELNRMSRVTRGRATLNLLDGVGIEVFVCFFRPWIGKPEAHR